MSSCIARQPIFNRSLNLYGYELLFRQTERSTGYDEADGDLASSETIMRGFHEIGIERVTNGKRAFVNFTEKLLLDQVATILPNQFLVIELLEDIRPTPEVLEAAQALRNKGYIIALDDFILEPEYLPLVQVADIIKIDMISTSMKKLEVFIDTVKNKPLKLLAEKLETYDEFERAKAMGFSLFQGYFFSKPVIVNAEVKFSPLKINCLQLIRMVYDPNVSFTKAAEIIKQDVALSYRLLRVVNSAYFGLKYTVNNIRQALAILGLGEFKKWITLISLSEISDNKPDELITMSLVRARFLELIAPRAGLRKYADDLFMLGLMSLMDAIMDLPFDQIIKLTNISESSGLALLSGEGKYGELLSIIMHYERSEWDEAFEMAAKHRISELDVANAYIHAVEWANLLK